MNSFIESVISTVTVIIILIIFYYYMDLVRTTHDDYENGKIDKLPWYIAPRWARDAWEPTWALILRTQIRLSTYSIFTH